MMDEASFFVPAERGIQRPRGELLARILHGAVRMTNAFKDGLKFYNPSGRQKMLKANEVRSMPKEDRKTRLSELRRDLMQERGVQAMGGSAVNPGKIRTLRREIARILTIQNEDVHGIVRSPAKAGKRESAK